MKKISDSIGIIDRVLSSSWCRCIETANLAFNDFIKKDFLTQHPIDLSFYLRVLLKRSLKILKIFHIIK